MATFVTTLKFTSKGIADIHETCERAKQFEVAAKKLKVKVTDTLWTQGPFDGLIVFEAPDPLTATVLMASLSSKGFVQTQTACAYRATEMKDILAKMPK